MPAEFGTYNLPFVSVCLVPPSLHHNNFDPANPVGCIENNPLIPRNCTITRPPPITRPCRSPVVLRPPLETSPPASALLQTDELLAKVRGMIVARRLWRFQSQNEMNAM